MENAGSSSNYQPFKRLQSLGKATKRPIRSLPQSPRKRQAIVSSLAKRLGVDLEKEMQASLSTNKWEHWPWRSTKYSPCLLFPLPCIIHYARTQGWNESRDKWKKRNAFENIILQCFCEKHFQCLKKYTLQSVFGFSTFCRLRPVNVFLLKKTPQDQCKCKTHENFRMKLKSYQR